MPKKTVSSPKTETWYVWREYITVDGEKNPRLLTPWSDDRVYEFQFDFLYHSPEEAVAGLEEFHCSEVPEVKAEMDEWVLVKMTMEVIPRPGK